MAYFSNDPYKKKKNFLIEESYGYIFHDYVKSTSRLNRQ